MKSEICSSHEGCKDGGHEDESITTACSCTFDLEPNPLFEQIYAAREILGAWIKTI